MVSWHKAKAHEEVVRLHPIEPEYTMMRALRQGLVQELPEQLVDELIAAYTELKRRYYLGDFRPNAVEGGRFSEAVFRILEVRCGAKLTPLGRSIETETLIKNLENPTALGTGQPDAVRIHIPRTLRLIYDIRNRRDIAHLGDGIDPNIQDATLVVANCDWVMAELVRLYHSVTPAEAQRIVENLVQKKVPVVQDIKGFLKTLNPNLGAGERILILLYQRGAEGATVAELTGWLKPTQRHNVSRVLSQLEHDDDYIHRCSGRAYITMRGLKHVEGSGFLEPIS